MEKYKTKDLPLLLALFFRRLVVFLLLFFDDDNGDESPAHYSFIIEVKFPITLVNKSKSVY